LIEWCGFEPLTGEILKTDESCYSGDYYYDIPSGKPLAALMRWVGKTSGDDILRQVDHIRLLRAHVLFNTVYLPVGLALSGLVLLWAAASRLRIRGRSE